ncbi:transposase [Acetivibrio saccincola]|uniref:transposase n=1 Tax=Acetivibrio saccincola TaxID=1677857 RepID=UPI000C6EF5B1
MKYQVHIRIYRCLTKDKKAVENSVTSQYSNGFVEGNNNRLKLIKRQMYGRVKLALLKAKIIIPSLKDIFLLYPSITFRIYR